MHKHVKQTPLSIPKRTYHQTTVTWLVHLLAAMLSTLICALRSATMMHFKATTAAFFIDTFQTTTRSLLNVYKSGQNEFICLWVFCSYTHSYLSVGCHRRFIVLAVTSHTINSLLHYIEWMLIVKEAHSTESTLEALSVRQKNCCDMLHFRNRALTSKPFFCSSIILFFSSFRVALLHIVFSFFDSILHRFMIAMVFASLVFPSDIVLPW